jgi:transcriptional regulator with XRE-family HTH domain
VVVFLGMRFGTYLRLQRLNAGLTQSQLARSARLTSAYINQLENSKATPPRRAACRLLARALGIDMNELWKYSFAARLERWLNKEGFRKTPGGVTSAFFDNLTGRE